MRYLPVLSVAKKEKKKKNKLRHVVRCKLRVRFHGAVLAWSWCVRGHAPRSGYREGHEFSGETVT